MTRPPSAPAAVHPSSGPAPDSSADPADAPRDAPRFGPVRHPGGPTRFRFWAPAADRVDLLLWPDGTGSTRDTPARACEMTRATEPGWFVAQFPEDLAGWRYAFRPDGGQAVPDPATRLAPEDVHGPGCVVDPDVYRWQCRDWAGIDWHRAVLYELHVGCFTPAGTFAAAIDRLDHLVALGVTAIEVMPVADFPGARNWGYDGVLPFAPDTRYGTPDDMRRFVDAAHQRGLAVLLDVVYNHFGPDGNYLGSYAPDFFTDRHRTPWGAAIDFEGPRSAAVRAFYVENARYWIDAFRLDGLRLDAVHAIHDASATHVLAEIAAALRERPPGAGQPPRPLHLVLENELNQASLLERAADGQPAVGTAQWNDDIHHALHVLITGETDGYYADFADTPAARLAGGLAHGFIYQGQPTRCTGEARGEPSDHLPTTAFVNFLQNHDQVGNRAFGERIGALAPAAAVRAAAACILLGPAIPLLFMGEEFSSASPFLYFCDADGDLAAAIREGRRREFGRFARFGDPAVAARIPDPCAPDTFERSRLDWAEAAADATGMLAFYRSALAARHRHVVPLLADGRAAATVRMLSDRAFMISWRFPRGTLVMAANFDAAATVDVPGDRVSNRVFSTGEFDGTRLGPFAVAVMT